MRSAFSAVASVWTLLSFTPVRAADPPSPLAQAAAIQDVMRKVIDAAEPSVVALVISHNQGYPEVSSAERARGTLGGYTSERLRLLGRSVERDRLDLSDPRNIPDNQYGSGVVLDETGLILTNYHLIENATKIYVRGPGGGGSYADVHAADYRSDLAVLKLLSPVRGLSAAKLSEVRVVDESRGRKATVSRGMWVITLAHPFAAGFADGTPSASWGILSSVRRRIPGYGTEDQRSSVAHLYQYGSLLQTDARLNLGCSGGALLNLEGEVIGLTSSVAAVSGSESGGGYAIPMTTNYRRIIETLKAGREVEYGFLGVVPGGMTQAPAPGLVITSVSYNTPAGLAGLQPNDVIQEIDGVPVRDPEDLFLNIGSALAGTQIQLKVSQPRRGGFGGQPRTVTVTLAKFLHPYPYIASVRSPAVHGLRVDYSSILAQQLINGNGFRMHQNGLTSQGVVVRELEPKSPAEAAFKALGGNDPTRWM